MTEFDYKHTLSIRKMITLYKKIESYIKYDDEIRGMHLILNNCYEVYNEIWLWTTKLAWKCKYNFSI